LELPLVSSTNITAVRKICVLEETSVTRLSTFC